MTWRWLAILAIAAGCKTDDARPVEPEPPAQRAPRDAAVDPDMPAPDPGYPTPRSVGSEKLWNLENPDRGPRAPTKFVLPPRATFAWTDRQTCEDDVVAPICMTTYPTDRFPWRVGRSKTMVVAESLRAGKVRRTYVYESNSDGTPARQLELDAYGAVATARMFVAPGRYNQRQPNGANALDGCGFMTFELDDKGHSVKRSCVQWGGAAMRDTHGVGSTKYVRDDKGFVIATTLWGTDGFPIVDESNVHQTLMEREPRDARVTLRRYRDTNGRPVASTSGCFGHRTTYDPVGAVTRRACLDSDDHPTTGTSGVAIETVQSDPHACEVGVRYFNADDTVTVNHDGIHGTDDQVDGYCAKVTTTCVGRDGRSRACGPGLAARMVRTRDPLGRVTSTKNYAADGVPDVDAEFEVFETRRRWDAVGNVIATACFDGEGRAEDCSRLGFHEVRSTWDDAAREIDQHFFDVAKQPTTNLGTFVRRYRYDNYDHLYETRNYDAADVIFEVEGYAMRHDLYDIAHRRVGILLYDRDAKPAHYRACYAGATCPVDKVWHAVRLVRRIDGTVSQNMFFDEHGKLVETLDCTLVKCFD